MDRPSVLQAAAFDRTVITTSFRGTPGPAGREGEASPTHGGVMTPGTLDPLPSTSADGTCLGITCLKWAADGELSERDVQLVLQRLQHLQQLTGVQCGRRQNCVTGNLRTQELQSGPPRMQWAEPYDRLTGGGGLTVGNVWRRMAVTNAYWGPRAIGLRFILPLLWCNQ